MLSKIPNPNEKFGKDTDKEILRVGIIAELDAINLYEQLAQATKDEKIKKILLDIAKEEKTHVGEFLELLLKRDKEQVSELKNGKKEVEEKTGK
jgi:rubrerythrin